MVECSFNAVYERDMDILFLEALASDPDFMKMVLFHTKFRNQEFQVLSAALSETEPGLGETDICVVLKIGDIRLGLLIEDKVDAIAMPNQHLRYHERGKRGIQKDKYDAYEVFIFCPCKYHDNNTEAQKYEHFISYEKMKCYFDHKKDVVSRVRSQQLAQAIARSKKPPEAIVNEAANLFFVKYRAYQKAFYPELDLRTSEKSNGWWPHYSTRLGEVYIYHKRTEGVVDLTFPKAVGKMDIFQKAAAWLRIHNLPNVTAVQTGQAAALRIEVPKIPLDAVFEDVEESEIKKCFDTIQSLADFANLIEDINAVSARKRKKSN